MKKKINKNFKTKVNNLFKLIKKNKIFKYCWKTHYIFRICIGIIILLFGIFAYLTPTPFATLILFLGLALIFPIKKIKSNFLYIINKTYIKHYIISIYLNYKYKNISKKNIKLIERPKIKFNKKI
ncbi:hypothetical protein VAMP_18n118 [Candidatus Vampirococcus lugosii]|uniref:Uncharacterized protein n=1 Tax=Candidatus Vampirococcus lugosii TaxID=2789015 RepID=A0ABS5QN03_9BACT|nr:hypothetical protein [Candidatus Vampirococcus lugosii]